MKKVVAVKSIKFCLLELIPSVVFIVLFVIGLNESIKDNFNDKEPILLLLLLFGVSITTMYLSLKTLLKPNVIIDEEDNGINIYLLFNRKIHTKYKEIINVIGEPTRAKYIVYKFGTVHIKTKSNKYSVGIVKDVKEVEEYIVKKVENSKRLIDF